MLIRHITIDLLKNKFIIAFTIFLFIVTLSLLFLDNNVHKTILGLLNITLFIIPLMSLIFTSIYFYNSIDFIELLLTQPIHRKTILNGFFYSFCIVFMLAILIGIGLPLLFFEITVQSILFIALSIILSIIFVAIALFLSVVIRDKAKGIGICLLIWFYFVFLYDGLILIFIILFSDYPIASVTLFVTFLNPVDIVRITLLSTFDAVSLLGFTGALFQEYFKGYWQYAFDGVTILGWVFVPYFFAKKTFLKKDF